MDAYRGFVVDAWDSGGRSLATGRLEDGRSFALALPARGGAVLVPSALAGRAAGLLEGLGAYPDPEPWSTMEGEPLLRLVLEPGSRARAERELARAGIRPTAVERGGAEELLAGLGVAGGVGISGESRPGRKVDLVFPAPLLVPSAVDPALRWLALDIETSREGGVLAVSLADGRGPGEVLFLGPDLAREDIASFDSEAALLAALSARIAARDPDIVTGWNVLDFDLRILGGRYAAHGLPFDFGRGEEPARLVEAEGRRLLVRIPGRAALDAMRLVRSAGERYEDQSLETVARTLLGEGKSVASAGRDKLEELDRLYRDEPAAFCSYCLRDSELVLRILGASGLDRLTVRRAALTGLPLELAWTSVPAFERVYAAGLRSRRVALPPREERVVSGAAGGTVLDPRAGLFEAVLVFDFRSLYPSLMRTFNIDPLAHARASARAPAAEDIVAPNGARFDREAGILPAAIERYTLEREKALAAGDDTAAFVYKILMNSFYGVLGSEGCRYARTELAGAITSFGKKYLHAARDFFEGKGYRVLYGDTDSVFVESGMAAATDPALLSALGDALAEELNALLAASIRAEFALESRLRIRREKTYARFFIPRLRLDPGAGEGGGRGRAKGYAGLRVDGPAPEVEIRGMEAARSDWTPLARRFQVELLGLIFDLGGGGASRATEEAVKARCVATVAALRRGELDAELVYRKSLRRPAEDYASETPQVRAARLMGWEGRRGTVRYVMTTAGAEPPDARSGAPVDYSHYVERQLLPIARAACEAAGWDPGPWLADRPQMELGF